MTTVADVLISRIIAELASGIVFDERAGRYRDLATGRFIAERRVLALAESAIENLYSPRIEKITDKLIGGDLTLDQWRDRMASEIRDSSRTSIMIGRGGNGAMTFSDWGRLGGRLRAQYRWLDQFAQDIKDGKLSAAQIRARAQMYMQSARTLYYDGRMAAAADAGYTEEMRVLGAAEHCDDCPPLAGYWSPIGSLPAIGQTQCMTNCKCTMRYRRTVVNQDGSVTYEEIG